MKQQSNSIYNTLFKVVLSVALAAGILYWMYRNFDFHSLREVLLHQMDWTWMLLSLPFGITAQLFRGLRWRQALWPLGQHPRRSTSINAVFLSYAVSLIIPRIGEFARCGVLSRYDNVSFTKALGTVVTERVIDSALVLLITLATFLSQYRVFNRFFSQTGTNIDMLLHSFSTAGWIVTGICAVAAIILVIYLFKTLSAYDKIKRTLLGLWQGILSVKDVDNVPLFIVLTLGIWVSYFLHYYLTFFCFTSTAHLGMACALVTFIVGSIAVIVPTPNGAGPWHFAVKTMLMLYGVSSANALYFVLIVHSIQTMLVAVIGIYAWLALMFTKKINPLNDNNNGRN